ncbi:HAD family hydrolase [Thermospira aquatica]|uniref:HAD family hydrolase n=1 Tax=Thermospira aquatica TaxID=2828656 RepID=A0AAX3BEN7_9SPIR|nr:HAD family hydrolase [Thermospira aquatica]URA10710.1 HAD family hydrolase [Thermospira aquatica]
MKIKAVVFDLYRTLIDDSGVEVQRENYIKESLYSLLEKNLYPVKHKEVVAAYQEMKEVMEDFHKRQVAFGAFSQVKYLAEKLHVNDHVLFHKMFDLYSMAVLHLSPKFMPHTLDALELLKDNGIKIGLISNTGITPGFALRLWLEERKVANLFHTMLFSDEVGVLKPNSLIFEIMAFCLGLAPESILFIGDTPTIDYEGALAAHFQAHLFKPEEENLYEIVAKYIGKV